MKKRKRPKIQEPSELLLEMPDLPALPPNWSVFVEVLRQRRYTSGDVHACIGVSRKVLMDWVRAGILSQLFHGLGAGKGDERFGKWRLFSILDIWSLAYFKRLRDEGIYIERLRQMKRKAEANPKFEGEMLQICMYSALPYWVHRQPYWLWTDMQGNFGHSPIRRLNLGVYFIQRAVTEMDRADLLLATNLIPLMDTVLALRGPLELKVDKGKGLLVRLEGQELRLEPLPKPDWK